MGKGRPSTLLDLVQRHPPERSALVGPGDTWTYGRLAEATSALATHLAGLAGERIAFMLPNGPEAVLTYLACWRSGAIAVPLNTRYAPPEIGRVLHRCRPRWLIVHNSGLDRLDAVEAAALADVRTVVVGGDGSADRFDDLLVPDEEAAASGEPTSDDPAVIFFTSGSTGEPKGVVHSHRSVRGILDSTSASLGDITPADVVAVCDPLMHISGFMETLTALDRGAKVPLLTGFDLPVFVRALQDHRPTLVCTHLDVLARLARDAGAERDWFASFRGVYTGGDTVPAVLQQDFHSVFGLPIGVGWGMTEAIWLTVSRTPRPERDGCIGSPLGEVAVRRDPGSGELQVRGPMVMSGYWEDDDLTRSTLAGGWLHTGDLGSQDENGVWWYEGRIKDLIVRRTSKITPGEVEAAIGRLRDVAAVAVIGAPDPDEGQVPVAFVVGRSGAALTAAGLLSELSDLLAAYKLPARVHFLDALPLTPSGKVDHRALREPEGSATGTHH